MQRKFGTLPRAIRGIHCTIFKVEGGVCQLDRDGVGEGEGEDPEEGVEGHLAVVLWLVHCVHNFP